MNSQNLDYVGYDLLDNVDTGLFDTNGTSINLRHHYVQLRKNIENPLKSNDSYWLKSFECTLEEFSKIDSVNSYLNEVKDQRYADKSINICGAFFKEIDRISKINNFYYLVLPYSEEFIAELKQKLLKFYNAYLRKIILINRSEKRNESLEKNFNNVYVLSNKSYEGIYKIGWTTNLAEERADQLSSETGVLYPFKVVFSKEFKNAEKIEKKIHTKFRKFRLRGNKEFFEIEKEKLIDFISNIED